MNIKFDREEALKQLRLMTFEKRAVATMTASGGNTGPNTGQQARGVIPQPAGSFAGSGSGAFFNTTNNISNALSSVNNFAAGLYRSARAPMKAGPPQQGLARSGQTASPKQLSVAKVAPAKSGKSTGTGMTTLASVGMSKAAYIVGLQKEAALPAVGAIGGGIFTGLRTAAAAGGLRGLASMAARYIPTATGAVKSFFKGFRSKPPGSPPTPNISTPRHGAGLDPSALGATKPIPPGIVDKTISFFKNVASSEAPRKMLSAGARDLAVRGAKGTANFAWNRGKSATKFGLGAGGLATGYSMMKNPELTFKQHLARATPYATAGAALGTGGVFGLGLPAAAMVKPSMERYLRKKKLIDPKKSLSIGSDFGKKTGILESDAARRRRITSGFSRLSTKDIKSYI